MRGRIHHWSVGLVLCAATTAAVAQGWLKDPITGCAVWSDKTEVERVVSWSGACSDGKASGNGVLVVMSAGKFDVRYDGSMTGGKANGLGLVAYRTDNGFAFYAGQFADSTLHGRGLSQYPDGSHYEGAFNKDVPHGLGTYTSANGETYQGQYVKGRREGWGTIFTADGDVYRGSFAADKPVGEIVLIRADGSQERQVWKDGARVK